MPFDSVAVVFAVAQMLCGCGEEVGAPDLASVDESSPIDVGGQVDSRRDDALNDLVSWRDFAPEQFDIALIPDATVFVGDAGSGDAAVGDMALPCIGFQAPVSYPVGGNAAGQILVVDVSGDNHADLIAPNGVALAILLGDGMGGFGKVTSFPAGTFTRDVASGDFNSDQHVDVAVTNENSSLIQIVLGKGDGTFGAPNGFSTGLSPAGVATADLNVDGKLDLAVANFDMSHAINPDTVSVLLGKGDGTFSPKTDYPTGDHPTDLVINDFDGDGQLDLVTCDFNGTVSLLIGNGKGTFGKPAQFVVGLYAGDVATGLLKDAVPDIVTISPPDNQVGVLLGKGKGAFANLKQFSTGKNPSGVALGDVNGDGKLDIVTANNIDQNVSAFLGDGNGGFAPYSSCGVGSDPYDVSVVDLNGDGKGDLVVGATDAVVLLAL